MRTPLADDIAIAPSGPSSVVGAFAHGAVGRWIDPSWGGPIELFFSIQPVLHDWCNCVILSVGWCI